mgnify:CR=1 FL=1
MIDPRKAVANEFAERVFDKLFQKHSTMTDGQAEEHVRITTEAVEKVLPRDRLKALAVAKAAAEALKVDYPSNFWPPTQAIVSAVKAAKPPPTGRGGPGDAPSLGNRGSVLVDQRERLDQAVRYGLPIPELPDLDLVASDLIRIQRFTESELRDAGWTGQRVKQEAPA